MNRPDFRNQTRKERYDSKKYTISPVSICCTNFSCDGNVAYLARALACFGGENLHIIGKVPQDSELKRLSGGTSSLVNIINHKRPEDFIKWSRVNDSFVITAELESGAKDIHETILPLNENIIFVCGNEMNGIPVEISMISDMMMYIPMGGPGFCLNTSQCGNILLYEYNRQLQQAKNANLQNVG